MQAYWETLAMQRNFCMNQCFNADFKVFNFTLKELN